MTNASKRSNTLRNRSGLRGRVACWEGWKDKAKVLRQTFESFPVFKRPFPLQIVSLLGVSKNLRSDVHMRIPASCAICGGPAIVYATVQGRQFRTQYRRCSTCGRTSKSVSMNRVLFSNDLSHERHPITDTAGVSQFTHSKEI